MTRRISILCGLSFAWMVAGSVFTPWAESQDPRIWLYDLLFYARYALLFWAAGEALNLVFRIRDAGSLRGMRVPFIILSFTALVTVLYAAMHHTGPGWQWRVRFSESALRAYQEPGFDQERRRVGWLLVDARSAPCGIQSWLWLGRTFGGGTGKNLALVHSPGAVPLTAMPDVFRFWNVHGDWWLAYQHPSRYREAKAGGCVHGIQVHSHAEGKQHIGR